MRVPPAWAGGCRGVPSGPLSWAAEALALMAHSQGPASACPRAHRTPSPVLGSRPGHSLQGEQRPGPLGSVWITIIAISGPEPRLGSAESSAAVTVQLLLPAAFPLSQAWLLWPLAVYLLSADLYLRVQRTRPKTAALTTLLQPAARGP